jgi:hypothetical protein
MLKVTNDTLGGNWTGLLLSGYEDKPTGISMESAMALLDPKIVITLHSLSPSVLRADFSFLKRDSHIPCCTQTPQQLGRGAEP